MNIIRLHIKKILCVLGLIAIVGILFQTNYVHGTFLSGWDSMQTELSPFLAVKRAFFSVWQEYQSFGLLAGMAHGADFVRALFVSFLTMIMPISMVRYTFHFLMIGLGALGMFQLISDSKEDSTEPPTFAFLGALLYILNYGIIQLISVPWEAFSVHIAFLPWLVWSFIRYVRLGTLRSLLVLFALNVLATPQAYVQTLFVVYVLALGVVSLSLIRGRSHVKRIFVSMVAIVCINAFWLLPQVYFVATGGPQGVKQAKINQLSTEDVLFDNRSFGGIDNFIRFEGFYTGIEGADKIPLFAPWIEHFKNPFVIILQYVLFAIIVIGMLHTSKYRGIFGGLFVLSACALLTRVVGIDLLNEFVRTWPLVGEIFRSPFTKFITLYALSASYFFAHGVRQVVPQRIRPSATIPIILTLALVMMSFPAFEGHYINRDMRVTIPQDYHDTIEHFRTVDKNKRIALMPDYTFWGWFFTDWGYNGSGFLWYGIEQPIVSRTFDVWSTSSEAYFWDMKAALEAEDVQAMEHVLEKYAIDYIIVDHSLRPVSSGDKALQKDRLAEMLKSSGRIRQFGAGKILSLYIFERNSAAQDFVSLSGPLQSVGPDVTYPVGSLFTEPYSVEEHPDIYFPFRNLTRQTRITEDQWALQEFENSFMLIGRIPTFPDLYQLDAPYDVAPVELFVGGEPRQFSTPFTYALDKVAGTISVTIPKALLQKIEPGKANVYDCTRSTVRRSDTDTRIAYVDGSIRVSSSTGATPCLGYDFPELNQRFGYLVSLKTRNLEGRRPFIALTDKTKDQPMIEDRLNADNEFFMLPPHFQYGQGYVLTLQNNSYVGTPSTNLIDSVEAYLFPIEQVRNIRFVKLEGANVADSVRQQFSAPAQVNKRAYHAYTIDLSAQDVALNEYLVLHQAYHAGWKAFWVPTDPISLYIPFIAGEPVDSYDHVKINDWEQGWKIPTRCAKDGGCRMVLIFWPQYLQWLGFALAIAAPGIIFARKLRAHSRSNSTSKAGAGAGAESGVTRGRTTEHMAQAPHRPHETIDTLEKEYVE